MAIYLVAALGLVLSSSGVVASEGGAPKGEAYGAGIDAVADRSDPWPSYGVGNYRPPSTGTFYGKLRLEGRYEWSDAPPGQRDRDSDLYAHLTLGTDGMWLEKLDLRFDGRVSKDIDGSSNPLTSLDPFIDARDVEHEHRFLFEIYTAYARYRAIEDTVDVTVGRQYVTEAEWVHFDGISFNAPRLGGLVSVGGFFGRWVHFYEEFEEKAVGGGHIIVHALPWLDIGLSDIASSDNLFELEVRAQPIEGLLVSPGFRMLDDDLERIYIDIDYWNEDLGLEARASFRRYFSSAETWAFGLTSQDSKFDRVRLRLPEPPASEDYEVAVWKELLPQMLGIEVGVFRKHIRRHRSQTGWEASFWEPWVALDLHPIEGLTIDAKATYADFHRPDVFVDRSDFQRVQEIVFDEEQRAVGEEDYLEIQVGLRYRMQDLFTVGGEYIFREYRAHTPFFDSQRFNANAFRVYARVDIIEGLSARVDYLYDEDLTDEPDGLRKSEAVWASVEYSF